MIKYSEKIVLKLSEYDPKYLVLIEIQSIVDDVVNGDKKIKEAVEEFKQYDKTLLASVLWFLRYHGYEQCYLPMNALILETGCGLEDNKGYLIEPIVLLDPDYIE